MKFRACAAVAAVRYPASAIDEVQAAIRSLDRSPDAASFMTKLAAPTQKPDPAG